MNRILLAVVGLLLAGSIYVWVRARPEVDPAPVTDTGRASPAIADGAADGGVARAELVDPRSVPETRSTERNPNGAAKEQGQGATEKEGGTNAGAAIPGVPVVPSSLPEVDGAPFEAKYGAATAEERRQALDLVIRTYKDAVAGQIKGSEDLIRELDAEMQWLETHLDP